MICGTDKYFQLGARCLDCGWRGKVGELVSRGTDNALAPFRCPTCDKQNTEWPLTTRGETVIMESFFHKLTPEQQKAALEYRGEDC